MASQLYQPPTKDELLDDLASLIPDEQERQAWLDTPNDMFGGKPPRTVLDAGGEGRLYVRDLLEAIKLGMTT